MLLSVVSWNVEKKNKIPSLSKLFERTVSPTPDIIAVGLQEVCSQFQVLRTEYGRKTNHLQIWIQQLEAGLKEIHGSLYRFETCARHGAIGLLVFVKQGLMVSQVQYGSIGTGLLGVHHNKGAVAISFVAQKQQTQALVCLCSAHLGPHEGFKNFEWRNTESDHILSQMAVGNRLLIEHPTLFLFGDLNYRMHDCKRDDILGWIQDKQIDMLLQRDELKALEKSKHLLSRFMEPKITFLPTYKLDSKREYSKKRLPAYCDRILYNSESVQPMSYDRVPFSLSDHDPVIAMFMFEPQEPNKASQVSSWIQRRLLFILRVNQFRILFLLLLWLGSVFFSRN